MCKNKKINRDANNTALGFLIVPGPAVRSQEERYPHSVGALGFFILKEVCYR